MEAQHTKQPDHQIFSQQNSRLYTDDQIIQMFLTTCCPSLNTRRSYLKAFRYFRKFTNYTALQLITWREIEAYKLYLQQRGAVTLDKALAPASVAAFLAPLKSFYRWGSDNNIGLFQHNPTTSVRLPVVHVVSQKHYLTRREVGILLNQLKGTNFRNYLIALSLVLLGMRVSELVAVRWGNFHTDVMESGVWLTLEHTKGGKTREIKVPQQLWKLYMEHAQTLAGHDSPTSELLLFPITTRQVERIIAQAGRESGLNKKVTPHWLRHTNATLALLNGASLQQVQENLGHSHINTTQRYMHTVEQLKKSATDFVEDSLKEFIH